MKRYVATLAAEFVIEAENIVEARRVASRIRAISRGGYGRRFSIHDPRGTAHSITDTFQKVTVARARPADPEHGSNEGGGR